tara:strand:- start:150 stop:377 length:228 start_codon:yes stop_codon:yes gene_type:complete
MTWREHCAPIIREIISETGKHDMKLLRKKLREAYPYGERAYWPYKVWLSEIKDQINGKHEVQAQIFNDPRQLELF